MEYKKLELLPDEKKEYDPMIVTKITRTEQKLLYKYAKNRNIKMSSLIKQLIIKAENDPGVKSWISSFKVPFNWGEDSGTFITIGARFSNWNLGGKCSGLYNILQHYILNELYEAYKPLEEEQHNLELEIKNQKSWTETLCRTDKEKKDKILLVLKLEKRLKVVESKIKDLTE